MAERISKKGKRIGRPKLPTNYFDDTTPFQVRVRTEILEPFIDAFHREKKRRKLTQKRGYFLNGVLQELMIKYIQAVREKEIIWEAANERVPETKQPDQE